MNTIARNESTAGCRGTTAFYPRLVTLEDRLAPALIASEMFLALPTILLSPPVSQGEPGTPGAPGAPGPVGPAGPVGATGAAGPQGLQGVQGIQGVQGLVGLAGPQGVQGAQGLPGVAGAQGPAGPAGATGPAGPAGQQGVQGTTGAQGPIGPAGAQGQVGVTGAQGPAGPAGAQGPAGLTGPAGGLVAFGYVYNQGAETVAIEAAVAFDMNGPLVGIAHAPGNAGVVFTNSGTYAIFYSVSGVEPGQFALFVNGAPVLGTVYGSGAGTQQDTGHALITISANDTLTLVNHTSAAAVTLQTLAGGTQVNVNASLLIEKLG